VRLLVIAVALVVLAGCRARDSDQAGADSSAAAQEPVAPPLRLTRANGEVFDLAEQRGRVVAIFFGYTHCPDFCPTTLADFASVKRRLRERGDSVTFVFITVDPARDTPAIADRYAKGFDRDFIGLSGDSATLADVQRGFRVASFIERDSVTGQVPEDYLVGHSALVFVVSKDGRIATLLPGDGRAEWLFNNLNEQLRQRG
jgi:protein SCO1/2